ncbi:MAG: DUF1674 domain-containing protein [Candidatus Eiseniibacteriota bacterium]
MEPRTETQPKPPAAAADPSNPKATDPKPAAPPSTAAPVPPAKDKAESKDKDRPREIGGPAGPDPTRYGDWEIKGRCIDF